MAVVYKCKECGGDIEIKDRGLGKCLYCGAVQTLPKDDDDNLKNLLNRANSYRLSCDFDRAIYLYEEAIKIDEKEPEIHWGLFLSKYGVEYVKDKGSNFYKPTLHRISSTSVYDDIDYKKTIELSDTYATEKYKQDAELIEKVLKEFLVISNNQAPYDIFLSYKEKDDITKQRTEDSFLAHDLYNELSGKGYNVFFAPKSLQSGLYEPQIYSAIISSKIMIVLGTRPKYFESVWVKNEWLRFAELVEKGERRIIIPVYKNMDAYDLPIKLAKYQAYNMSDISFLQSIESTINNYIDNRNNQNFITNVSQEEATLERGFIALEDKDFIAANNFFENTLSINPHCAKAYFGKFMCNAKVKNSNEILTLDKPLNQYTDFQKALKFADSNFKSTLISLEQTVQESIDKVYLGNFKKAFGNITSISDIDNIRKNYDINKISNLDKSKSWDCVLNKMSNCYEKYEPLINCKKEEFNKIENKFEKYKKIADNPVVLKFIFTTSAGWIIGLITLLWGFIFGLIIGVLELIFKPPIIKKIIENTQRDKDAISNEINSLEKNSEKELAEIKMSN